jgi:di/tricarboxylate transporter
MTNQIIYLVILVTAFGLLLTERLRNDVVAVGIIVALAVTGVLEPQQALAGFSSEPAIVVVAIFVLSGAIHQTGLAEIIGGWIGRLAGRSEVRALAVIMPAVALLSAFTHHLTTTAVMLPVTLNLARERGIPASKLLMPLSFAASLGTTITIIGAPAFLLASGVLQQAGQPGLGIFSIAPIGLALSAVGTLFVVLAGRFLLPANPEGEGGAERFRLDDYFTELTILPESPFLGKTIAQVRANGRYQFNIVGLVRDGVRLQGLPERWPLAAGDVLRVRTSPEELVTISQEAGIELHPVAKYGSGSTRHEDDLAERLVQAVVAPGSDLVGRTIGEADIRRRYDVIVVGLWRQHGWLHEALARTRLHAGDVLVLQGDQAALERVRTDPRFLMLVPFHGEPRLRSRAALAGAIMLATILVTVFGWLSLQIATVAGALAMVLTRCITARQAYRAIDGRIYVFIAGALPLGAAMQETGTSDMIAAQLHGSLGGLSQYLVLAALFALVAVLTQFMSDAATTAIFAPVALALATALGHSPTAYVVTVAMASVAAFLTPIGHHGNLLVYGPGRYQFADFFKVGAPLTLLVGAIVVTLAPLLWPA